jgi:hypothetical protein
MIYFILFYRFIEKSLTICNLSSIVHKFIRLIYLSLLKNDININSRMEIIKCQNCASIEIGDEVKIIKRLFKEYRSFVQLIRYRRFINFKGQIFK